MRRWLPLFLLSAALITACSGGRDSADTPPAGPDPLRQVASSSDPSVFELDAEPIAEVRSLCLFRPRKDPVMSGYSDRTGGQWEGEIQVRDLPNMDPKWFSPSDKRVATAVARPRVDRFRMRIDANCHDPARNVYYSCSKVLEADFSKIRGFARALSIERARALAVQLCEKKVKELVSTSLELQQENQDLTCRVDEQAYCALPPEPPPPTPPKKK